MTNDEPTLFDGLAPDPSADDTAHTTSERAAPVNDLDNAKTQRRQDAKDKKLLVQFSAFSSWRLGDLATWRDTERASPSCNPPSAIRHPPSPSPSPKWLRRAQTQGHDDRGARRSLWAGYAVVGLLTIGLLALLGRVVQLQAQPDERVTALLETHESEHSIMGRRGALLDRRGRVLAGGRVGYRLFADPHLIEDFASFDDRIAHALDYDPVRIAKTLGGAAHRRYVVLDERLTDERLATVREMDVPGLYIEPVLVRDYPQGRVAGQVVGFVGRDGAGLAGLEARFNETLKPSTGHMRYLRDARRRALWMQTAAYRPHENGETVRLSLDVVIQSYAEEALKNAVETYGASHGEIVVMDPHTGEVLALANYPRFDPREFQEVKAEARRNRAVTDTFEPGSIFKPFVWAVATQLGVAEPMEMIDTSEQGYYVTNEGRTLHDAHGHGTITWNQVLILSSNIGMAKVGQRMGVEDMHAGVEAFGFGEPTGSGLPGEVGGLLRPAEKWTSYSLGSIPMGQELSVTPLQVTRAFCAFANDGVLVTPTLRKHGEASDATDVSVVPVEKRVLRRPVAAHTRRMLRRVVTEGTGRKVKDSEYAIFGKTGTAQMPNLEEGGYYQQRYVASFIGGAPTDEPRLIVGCFIHDPDREKGHYGGTVAAPAVQDVLERSLRYMGVAPSAREGDVRRAMHR